MPEMGKPRNAIAIILTMIELEKKRSYFIYNVHACQLELVCKVKIDCCFVVCIFRPMRLWLLNPGLILKQVRSGGLLASVEVLSGIHVTCMCASCYVAVGMHIVVVAKGHMYHSVNC